MSPGVAAFQPLQRPVIDELRRLDLHGKSVLDIGCRDGLYCFEAERLGAARVLGIDNDLSPAATEFLIPFFKSLVRMGEINIYDFKVAPEERFDVVILAGVLYHLRFPFYGLKCVIDLLKPGGTLIVETALLLNFEKEPVLWCPPEAERPPRSTSVSYFNHPGLCAALSDFGMEQIECRAVISPSEGWPRYSSWEDFRSGPQGSFAESQTNVHGRGTYVAVRRLVEPADSQSGADYFYRTHDMHHLSQEGERQRQAREWFAQHQGERAG